MNIHNFLEKKRKGEKISMLTCYDFSFATILNESKVDCLLVGDSLAMVMHGHSTTIGATVNMMSLHTRAVSIGAPKKFVIADLPFLSYRLNLSESMKCIAKLMRSGAQAIKLEGAKGNIELIKHCVESGVPVMGHLGLTPQSIHQLGGFKVQGKNPLQYDEILKDSQALENAGCFAVVLECVPSGLAKEISEKLKIPTIGIGAGAHCDGQVLVLQDMLGMNNHFSPKFLRKYFSGYSELKTKFDEFHDDVVNKKFPNEVESY